MTMDCCCSTAQDHCVFLSEDMTCTIHEVRPAQCSTYPWWPDVLESAEAWEQERGPIYADDARLIKTSALHCLHAGSPSLTMRHECLLLHLHHCTSPPKRHCEMLVDGCIMPNLFLLINPANNAQLPRMNLLNAIGSLTSLMPCILSGNLRGALPPGGRRAGRRGGCRGAQEANRERGPPAALVPRPPQEEQE